MSTGVKTMSENHLGEDNSYNWVDEYDLEPHGFSKDVSNRFFSDDSPNKLPLIDVQVKLAANINITDDSELVNEVVDYWFPDSPDRFTEVAVIVFNDMSVWHLPLASWDKDYENFRLDIVERYIPDIVQWRAVVEGEDPSEALDAYESQLLGEGEEASWIHDVEDTSMTDEQRKWFNRYVDWLDHIDREVEASDSIDLQLSNDDDWQDDW